MAGGSSLPMDSLRPPQGGAPPPLLAPRVTSEQLQVTRAESTRAGKEVGCRSFTIYGVFRQEDESWEEAVHSPALGVGGGR